MRAGWLMLMLMVSGGAARAEPYRLAEDDAVRLVAPAAPGLAGVYLLGEGGRIALPVAGGVALGGMTLDEATASLVAALEADIVAPVIGLELVARRPFYIAGAVASPGAYPGAAGLTLSRAVALAGGERRGGGSDPLQEAVTGIRSREELARSLRDRAAGAVRLARLEAELAGAAFAPEPATVPGVTAEEAAAMIAREAAVLESGRAAHEERMAGITRLLLARQQEIAALEGRLAASGRQTAQIEQEITDARDLLNRGLAPAARLNGLLREADRQQSDVLQIRVLLNQALQAVAGLELDRANVPRERVIALTEQVSDLKARQAALALSVSAAQSVLEETGGSATHEAGLRFRVERADGSGTVETADGSLPVAGGDLVTVLRGAVVGAVAAIAPGAAP